MVYRTTQRIDEGLRNSVEVQFAPGQWYSVSGRQASREEIMMTLANVQNLLIKLQYIDQVQREVEILNIVMDSAANTDLGLGSASLVEECRCPNGYSGLSCENCAHGFVRQQTGAWLGRCIAEEEPCRAFTYGDPNRGIACQPCPCPLTNSGNNFARTCYLGPDNDVVCNCERGYKGRRCEECEEGFVGNPLQPGGSCVRKPSPPPSICDSRGTQRVLQDGRCECKQFVTGPRCDQCTGKSFLLNPRTVTGCIDCFCSGVTKECSSSSFYRDSVRATFTPYRNEFSIITDYENPSEVEQSLSTANSEVSFRGNAGDTSVYFWRLPSRFAGNKLTSYGGHLNYSIRYVPTPGGIMSRNNAPDVVIRSLNDITILHYRRDEVSPSGLQQYAVPIFEDEWQRIDGNRINREHLLMTLADVSDIFIKATYTTTTDEAALSQVSLDTASPHFTGSYVRAIEVEQCQCPRGFQGLSCEDCAPGYTRSGSGLYLGLCELCQCNGHSEECDPETGACHNCRDNTEGDHCEECASGFSGNATRGSRSDCTGDDGHDQIESCKQNVVGSYCDQCREGTYNLDESNILGCTECFCSGTTRACTSSRLFRDQVPMLVLDDKFPLTNRIGEVQTEDEPRIDLATSKLSHDIHDGNTYYWSLPPRFLGNQLKSYNGFLNFTVENEAYGGYQPDQDVIIRGNGITLFWIRGNPDERVTTARLRETEWQTSERNGPKIASRAELLTVLSHLEGVLIRATIREGVSEAHISDISLDTAVQQNTGQNTVADVEICRCPEGYTGSSCEVKKKSIQTKRKRNFMYRCNDFYFFI